jgi:hypothetical protein
MLLVRNSADQKSGTVNTCLVTTAFGGVAPLSLSLRGARSLIASHTSYSPGGTDIARLMREGGAAAPAAGAALRAVSAGSAFKSMK